MSSKEAQCDARLEHSAAYSTGRSAIVDRILSAFLRAVLLRMKELGLNNTALAKRMNVSRPYVTKVLSGDVNISFGSAAKLARALQMDFFPELRAKPTAVSSQPLPNN